MENNFRLITDVEKSFPHWWITKNLATLFHITNRSSNELLEMTRFLDFPASLFKINIFRMWTSGGGGGVRVWGEVEEWDINQALHFEHFASQWKSRDIQGPNSSASRAKWQHVLGNIKYNSSITSSQIFRNEKFWNPRSFKRIVLQKPFLKEQEKREGEKERTQSFKRHWNLRKYTSYRIP